MLKRIFITVILCTFIAAAVQAAVKLKVAVVNPSQTKKQTTPVRFDLPKGISPEHILDIGEMELKYDFDKEVYYIYRIVTLQPAEKIIIEVKLQDVWVIHEEEIGFLKEHTGMLANKLKETKYFDVGISLSKKIKDTLDRISKIQKETTSNIKEKINNYYENVGILSGVKADIGMLENLVIDVGGIIEERVEVPATLAVSFAEDGKFAQEETVELNVKISNPSKKRTQIIPIRYALPEEVSPRYILDSSGLDVGYDFDKQSFYVYKDEIELGPLETKTFIIKIKDIWRIPEVEIGSLKTHTNNLMLLLDGTEYFNQGKPIADKISFNLDGINESQSLKVGVAQHIAYYRSNTFTLRETKKYISQLEKILTQSGVTPGVTIAKAEILKGGGPEVKRERGYKGISFIAESIFKGKAPTPATTWKIIFAILGFVGIVGGSFFILWYVQAKKRIHQGAGGSGQGAEKTEP